MVKVTCESCNTSFMYKAVKDMTDCPVCGKPLWENEDDTTTFTETAEAEEGLMYLKEIMLFEDEPQYNSVILVCNACGEKLYLDTNNFEELVDEKYVTLKKDFVLKCEKCGGEQKPRKILYKKSENVAPPRPQCPLCSSFQLRKIKASSKILSAATLGIFSSNIGKTFECMNCHYKF